MSSALRLSIIAVLLLATTALGLIALNLNTPSKAPTEEVVQQAPAPKAVGYYVAARPLPRGTLARDEDFVVRSAQADRVPAEAILETLDSKASLSGSLVRKFVEAGSPITLNDIVRPQDRGFLASVLAPDTRAISIKVDEESGVSGLIRPGDRVDVLLTQMFEKADPGRRALSETVLRNVRIIAIDQEIVQGGRAIVASAKQAATVSLELLPDQVQRITVAKQLGKLSLSVRAALMDKRDNLDARAMSSCDVSPELARQNAAAGQTTAIIVYSGGEAKQFSVKKQVADNSANCDASDVARLTAAAAGAGNLPEKR
ncbi:Flp pilus assembly protein CpaB [Bradyrhizobium sp. AUGA SZCCT0283]|uniref:Flp pilus assembly protein CpaB n=1 Tax=Bradyrhizobium sp. AUGA SZCCT0283 TaxID=2807671 RepID=UPI001BAA05E4|nr:Flp pilus assembly protein CpaB [Bradyrhizobium sp. AUGA SZCCT0283]MBR1279250.1 Flp pilus assembly protein CpaB [Bradyrhizobium sp. AUGA SZCCT0283]